MTEMMELIGKNAKAFIINKFHILKIIGENTNTVRRKTKEDGNETSKKIHYLMLKLHWIGLTDCIQ